MEEMTAKRRLRRNKIRAAGAAAAAMPMKRGWRRSRPRRAIPRTSRLAGYKPAILNWWNAAAMAARSATTCFQVIRPAPLNSYFNVDCLL